MMKQNDKLIAILNTVSALFGVIASLLNLIKEIRYEPQQGWGYRLAPVSVSSLYHVQTET